MTEACHGNLSLPAGYITWRIKTYQTFLILAFFTFKQAYASYLGAFSLFCTQYVCYHKFASAHLIQFCTILLGVLKTKTPKTPKTPKLFLWKVKTSKRQEVSFLLETRHNFFDWKRSQFPQMPVKDAHSSLKILATSAQLSVTLAIGWS